MKRNHTNRKTTKMKPVQLYQPQSPAGKVRNKKGKTSNLGLADPLTPSWRGAPYKGAFITPIKFGS